MIIAWGKGKKELFKEDEILLKQRRKLIDYLLVSLATPSSNEWQYIEEVILSVKNQDYLRTEHIIIVDGGLQITL